jgi:heme oxygenase
MAGMEREPPDSTRAATVMESGLADALRQGTAALHREAEQSGIVHDILHRRASRSGYALLLRNLLPAYQEMERGLTRLHAAPGVREIVRPELYRAAALAADLEALCGRSWSRSLALLPAGERYARRVALAARGDGSRLIGHAYTRYLGDLSGGQALKRLLARSLGLCPQELAFYDFPAIGDLESFKLAYRGTLDRAGTEIADRAAVVDEAVRAFRLNILVSTAVQRTSVRRSEP